MAGSRIGILDNLCIPEPGHYLTPSKFKFFISTWMYFPGKSLSKTALRGYFWTIKNNVFYKQHFYKKHQYEIGKNQAKAKQYSSTELLIFESYLLSSCTLSPKNKAHSKEYVVKQVCQFLKMKKRSGRYDINRPWPRHGHK